MGVDLKELKNLKDPFVLKWRVKSLIPDNKKPTEMVLIGYIDARQVQERFDEVLGPHNWQDEYFECKGKQFCKIGIKIGEEWIWKGDSGTESFADPSKGETSDSFKRAAVHWGLNRDSYELGEITIKCKVFDGIPSPVDASGNKLSGPLLLAECKRIAATKESELIFDRNVMPVKPAIVESAPAKRGRKSTKSKVILP